MSVDMAPKGKAKAKGRRCTRCFRAGGCGDGSPVAFVVLEEQHVKMGIHGWVFSAHLREHSSRYVSHALWPRLSSTLSRSSRVLVYSAKGYYECEGGSHGSSSSASRCLHPDE